MVVNEFAAALGINDAGSTQNSQMLRCYGLLQSEFDKNVGHIHSIAFFQKCDDALAQFVIDGPQDKHRFSKFGIVKLYVVKPLLEYNCLSFLFSHGESIGVGIIASQSGIQRLYQKFQMLNLVHL